MAARARLAPPRAVREHWPWHEVRSTAMSASTLSSGERRFEADSYLSSGFGIRLAMETKTEGWERLGGIARNWQPPRLKGIQVDPGFGLPYLSATQVFDLRPVPRKFLSLHQVRDVDQLSVDAGQILVTRSGTVGRVTLAHVMHEKTVVSDDLIRVVPLDDTHYGWIYAYLRSPSARQMMRSAHYGHMIKHLETSHLDALPIPCVPPDVLADFNDKVRVVADRRNRSYARMLEAESMFEAAVGGLPVPDAATGFEMQASVAFGQGRRRLEASYHSPGVRAILRRFEGSGLTVEPLRQLTRRVWWMTRFKRVFGDGGVPYLSSDELFTLNPDYSKRILLDHEGAAEAEGFFVQKGWLVMACSGQTYGLNGSVALVNDTLAGCFLSHDIVRIQPNDDVRSGYLLVALSHPRLGRPLVIRTAYGSSIPHLDPDDVADIGVVRLGERVEGEIADVAEEAAKLRDEADKLENEVTAQAEHVVTEFLAT